MKMVISISDTYCGKVANAKITKHGDTGWEIELNTPAGTTRDFVTEFEDVKRLWAFMVDVVDAWDEYGKEVD